MQVSQNENTKALVSETKQPELNRHQKRFVERIEKEAKEMHSRLAEQFFNFFMENDPESEAVENKAKEVNAKWRLYAKNRQLNPESNNLLKSYCELLKADYIASKNHTDDKVSD